MMHKIQFLFNQIICTGAIFFLIASTSCMDFSKDFDLVPVVKLENTVENGYCKLSWNKVNLKHFVRYEILRYSTNIMLNESQYYDVSQVISILPNSSTTTYIDKSDLTGPNNYYILRVVFLDYEMNEVRAYSNVILYTENSLAFRIVNAEYQPDSGIKIEWNPVSTDSFLRYELYRTETNNPMDANYPLSNNSRLISIFNKKTETSFIDREPNYTSPSTTYAVKIISKQGYSFAENIKSVPNKRYLDFIPDEVLVNPSNERLLLFSGKNKTIIEYDPITLAKTKTINTGSIFGRPALYEYEGKKLLFVPVHDGTIAIYNTDNMSAYSRPSSGFTDKLSSVVLKGDILFYVVQSGTSMYGNSRVAAINLKSGIKLDVNQSGNHNFNFYIVNSRDNWFLGITPGNYSVDVIRPEFAGNTVTLTEKYSEMYDQVNNTLMELSPDLTTFVSSLDARHFKINFDVIANGSSGYRFSWLGSFGEKADAFNDFHWFNNTIYCASTSNRKVTIYRVDGYKIPLKTILMENKPLFVRKTQTGLFAITDLEQGSIVEKLNE